MSIVNVEYPESVLPNTKFRVRVTVRNETDEEGWFSISLTDSDTDKSWGKAGVRIAAGSWAGWGFFPIMPEEGNLNLEVTVENEEMDSQSFTVYEKIEEEPSPPPKACIIATVFLGQQHPFLPPMRKFRDIFIPRQVMDAYYGLSVFFLRKMGKLTDEDQGCR